MNQPWEKLISCNKGDMNIIQISLCTVDIMYLSFLWFFFPLRKISPSAKTLEILIYPPCVLPTGFKPVYTVPHSSFPWYPSSSPISCLCPAHSPYLTLMLPWQQHDNPKQIKLVKGQCQQKLKKSEDSKEIFWLLWVGCRGSILMSLAR